MAKLSSMPRETDDTTDDTAAEEWTEATLLETVSLLDRVNALFGALAANKSVRSLLSSYAWNDLIQLDYEVETFMEDWNGEEDD